MYTGIILNKNINDYFNIFYIKMNYLCGNEEIVKLW